MVILKRQQIARLALQPALARQRLALRTVAVAARVVRDPFLSTVEAAFHVAAQLRGAAPRQVPQRFLLRRRQMFPVSGEEGLAVAANHVRHLQGRTRCDHGLSHGAPPWPRLAGPADRAVCACGAGSNAGTAPSSRVACVPTASAASPRPRLLPAGASRSCASACAYWPSSASPHAPPRAA